MSGGRSTWQARPGRHDKEAFAPVLGALGREVQGDEIAEFGNAEGQAALCALSPYSRRLRRRECAALTSLSCLVPAPLAPEPGNSTRLRAPSGLRSTAWPSRRARGLAPRIVSTLVAYGFGEIVYQTGVGRLLYVLSRPFRGKRRHEGAMRQEPTTWVRIRMVIEHLGLTFIKLGQILSNRNDLIPRPLQRELARLRDNVPPFPAVEAIKIIEEDLGRPVEELFRHFDEQPMAAASVAQIHRATLPGGEAVVVKVQRPGLEELAQVDVEILKELAGVIERHFPETRSVAPATLQPSLNKACAKSWILFDKLLQ